MGARGFTLIEVMVVMAVLALMLVLISPNFSSALPGVSLKAAARTLAGGLRHARSRAIALNEEVALVIDVESRRYAIVGGDTSGKLPGEGDAKIRAADLMPYPVFLAEIDDRDQDKVLRADRWRDFIPQAIPLAETIFPGL